MHIPKDRFSNVGYQLIICQGPYNELVANIRYKFILESPPHFENRIMAGVNVMGITRNNMYQKATFC